MTPTSRRYASGSSTLCGALHDTKPASRGDLVNSTARSAVSSPVPSPRRSSHRPSCSNCHSLLADADAEYDRDRSHTANPVANGANGPDGVRTHTFLLIDASNRIAQNMNPTGVGRINDHVERIRAPTSDFAAKSWPAKPRLNIGAGVTYNPA
jgi:hypothetical protein